MKILLAVHLNAIRLNITYISACAPKKLKEFSLFFQMRLFKLVKYGSTAGLVALASGSGSGVSFGKYVLMNICFQIIYVQ